MKLNRILFLSDEGPTLKTLDYTIHIDSTPTFLYFEFVNYYKLLQSKIVNDLKHIKNNY